MRDILFRGKRKDNDEWIYGNTVIHCEKYYIYYEEPDEMCQVGSWRCGAEVIPETVGQYTGLTDKNGKKIFEGDICQHRSYYSDNIVISVVTYTDGQFLAMPDKNSGFNLSDKLEVIGNIYENEDLLKCENQ